MRTNRQLFTRDLAPGILQHWRACEGQLFRRVEHRPTASDIPGVYDLKELVTIGDMAPDRFATTPSHRASEYFAARAQDILEHLEAQRNISDGSDDCAWKLLMARRGFARLAPKYSSKADDEGPFRLFCDDLRPTNMLVDPETLRITAVLEFEFTNAIPAQHVYDVPWWLLLEHPVVLLGGSGGKK